MHLDTPKRSKKSTPKREGVKAGYSEATADFQMSLSKDWINLRKRHQWLASADAARFATEIGFLWRDLGCRDIFQHQLFL
jgi:hypothetical protein